MERCALLSPRFKKAAYGVGRVFVLLLLTSATVIAQAPRSLLLQESLPETQPSETDDAEPWLLAELEVYAQEVSPDLKQAASEVQVQRGRAHQAGLYPNPVLEGGSTQLGGDSSQYYMQLSQEIVTKQKLQLDQAAICREVVQAELRFVRTRYELLTRVRQGFYGTLTAQRRLEVLEELMRIVGRSATAAQSLEKGGEGSRGDTLLLELELERADVTLQNAAVTLLANQRQLAATLGDPDLKIEQLSGDLRQSLPDYPFELTEQGVITSNSLVQAAQVEIERQWILLRRARVDPIPNITATSGYLNQLQQPHDQAIVSLSFPLPVWNKNQGNIQATQANISRATHTLRRTQVDLVRELAGATGRFDVARQQVAKYEKSILPKAREAVKISQQGFKQGQFDLLRVLQSQRTLIDSQLNYLNSQEARWSAAAEIAGLLQEDDFPKRPDADSK